MAETLDKIRQASVGVTSEMIEAGAEIVAGWDERFEDTHSIAYDVYVAMLEVKAKNCRSGAGALVTDPSNETQVGGTIMSQDHREYIGSIPELRGMSALLRGSSIPDMVEAQFNLTVVHPETGLRLDLNWHEFNTKDFIDKFTNVFDQKVHYMAMVGANSRFPSADVCQKDYAWAARLLRDQRDTIYHLQAEIAQLRSGQRESQITMADLWLPISELDNITRDHGELLIRAPELIDLDCNTHGVAPGYWQDGPLTLGGDEEGEWIAAGYCMQHDHFVNKVCNPTHFLILEGPKL